MRVVNDSLMKGFSLIEIALALLLVGIFFTSMFTSTSALTLLEKQQKQTNAMSDIHQAMLTYLKVNRHLPCPDTDGDGKENRKVTSGVAVCKSRSGSLPYRDISVDGKDAWGNAYYYQVNARAENKKYVNDMCQTSSVFGSQGAVTVSNKLAYCASAHVYYCQACDSVCSTACKTGGSIDVSSFNAPPYMQLGTPPIGSDKAGSGTNSHKNLWLEDLSGNEIENALVYMVASFGADGLVTWDNCQKADSSRQKENCDGDEVFSETKGDNQDFLDSMTVLDAKRALLEVGAIK
ncbi:hypothetical protein EI16_09445 [Hydrogenovibrio marinus]|uniref:Prepilin-type N-terminal cleavage/methylation domain-containing protein n=2 Tax=Hydrogenovibrio marinus TaxID=28885 RepID=A0A067A1H6_HYDMR|nr:hypothetical protein EI16_09445 [Hydrogenovibrio marinus]BBN60325.1 hypothetical protein HVMH_1919 [Hydrogenovibrio marinus]